MMAAFNVKLTNAAAKAMFARYDQSGDGTIGYEEFKTQVSPSPSPETPPGLSPLLGSR